MNRYIRKGRKYSVTEIMGLIFEYNGLHKTIDLEGDSIITSSAKLYTFKHDGTTCRGCGLNGSFFVKERQHHGIRHFSLNLYGISKEGKEVLFTSDHIIPLSKGGATGIKNRQTMCANCNNIKNNRCSRSDEKNGVRRGKSSMSRGPTRTTSSKMRAIPKNRRALAIYRNSSYIYMTKPRCSVSGEIECR